MPSLWTTTSYSLSWFDGYFRRGLIGTVLFPITSLVGYEYELYAGVALLVLAVLVLLCGNLVWRYAGTGRALVVLALFASPYGAFMFHEVGYQEQVLYLMFFASAGLLSVRRWKAAVALMALTPLVHEAALLTVLPLFALLYCARTDLPRSGRYWIGATALLNLVVGFVVPNPSWAAHDALVAKYNTDSFEFREAALMSYNFKPYMMWTHGEVYRDARLLLPLLVIVLLTTTLLVLDRRRGRDSSLVQQVATVATACVPFVLVGVGFDWNRWGLMLLGNCLIVGWHLLPDTQVAGTTTRQVAWRRGSLLLFAGIVAWAAPLEYFENDEPRRLDISSVRDFAQQLLDGRLFDIPPDHSGSNPMKREVAPKT